MTTLCSTEVLASALVGNLPPDREAALQRHLEECDECSAALERMAGGDPWCADAALLLGQEDSDDGLPAKEDWSAIDFTVEHLEPADDPNLLGRLGGYDVLEIVGRGGMGVVLKGFERELKRCVAIKVLAPHLAQSPLARKRFAREAQAAAAVVHPHVLAIHQVQASGRLPFLVMPLVAGESLAQRLAAKGTLELKEILRIGMQAAAGLGAAHEQGLVHRDVKPANILLEKGVERAVLTDFGLARAADDATITRWGFISGTPQYMSPEQARGESLDGRSDLFSLGCVLFEMATGVSPFRSESTMATLRRLIDDPPPSMTSLNPELPCWFVAIVGRLLEKNPADRFASAKEVSELLEGCLAHVQQPANVPLPAAIPEASIHVWGTLSSSYGRVLAGALAMIALIAIGLACFFGPPGKSGEEAKAPEGSSEYVELSLGLARGAPGGSNDPSRPAAVTTIQVGPKDSTALSLLTTRLGESGGEDYEQLKQIFRAVLPVDCAKEIAHAKAINWKTCTSCHARPDATPAAEQDAKSTEARVERLEAAMRQIDRLLAEQRQAARVRANANRAELVADTLTVKLPEAAVKFQGRGRTYLVVADPKGAILTANNQHGQTMWRTHFTEVLPVWKGGNWSISENDDKETVLRWSPAEPGAQTAFLFHFDTNSGQLRQQVTELVARDPKRVALGLDEAKLVQATPAEKGDERGADQRLRVLERALAQFQLSRQQEETGGAPMQPVNPVNRRNTAVVAEREPEEVDLSVLGVRYLDAVAQTKLLKSRLARIRRATPEQEEAEIALESAMQKEQLLAGLIEGGHRSAVAVREAAQNDLRRSQELAKQGLIAQSELERAQTRAQTADARVQQFETILKARSGADPRAPGGRTGMPGGRSGILLPGWFPGGEVKPPALPGANPMGAPGPGNPAGAEAPPTASENLLRAIGLRDPFGLDQTKNDLKQIGLAMHAYHDTHGRLPAAASMRDGKPLLSWRVAILPYIEQEALYRQFHLDEAWDSDHNSKLLERMPAVFAGKNLKPGYTTIVAPTGKGFVFHDSERRKLTDIVDGTSNTIMLATVKPERAVRWTEPADLPVDVNQPAAGLEDRFVALFADGSIRVFSLPMDKQELLKLLQISDSNALPLPRAAIPGLPGLPGAGLPGAAPGIDPNTPPVALPAADAPQR